MTRRKARRRAAVIAGAALAIVGGFTRQDARAENAPPAAAIAAPGSRAGDIAGADVNLIRRPAARTPGATRGGPWWLGSVGVVAVFAGLGYAVWAARRGTLRLARTPRGLEVVGRTALTPRHQVHLLRAGDRILLIGTGPGGSPAFLGEWTGPDPTQPASTPRRAGGGA